MLPDTRATLPTPRAFISYSWDSDAHKAWVRDFAARLRQDGVETTLDQWHTGPGDQLPLFMERSIRDSDYVLVVCTPSYAERSNNRTGAVGYEGDIMTGEVLTHLNVRKFIPIYRSGPTWADAAPSWLAGKYHLDLRGDPYREDQYQDLFHTLHRTRPVAPPVVPRPVTSLEPRPPGPPVYRWEPVRILGVIVDEVSQPKNDGSRGSALYSVPFRLSRSPSRMWCERFVRAWDRPSSYTTGHRPGIARVDGDKIILSGTTIDEVARVHRDTLMRAAQAANEQMEIVEAEMTAKARRDYQEREDRARHLHETAAKITFD